MATSARDVSVPIERQGSRTAEGIAFVSEVVFVSEDDDFQYSSGRFSAEWSPEDGDGTIELGPQAVDVDEALAWARSKAARVIVEIGTDRRAFTAGADPAASGLDPWPG